jgi:hypothetical protein
MSLAAWPHLPSMPIVALKSAAFQASRSHRFDAAIVALLVNGIGF